MTAIHEIVSYTDQLLQTGLFQDYCPNGLQVEGKSDIKTIVTGVTANQALINQAIANKADLILVHHGFFWKGEKETIVGMKRQRLQSLLLHNINLIAYHLPLDAHPIYGNNIQLAERLNLTIQGPLSSNYPGNLIWFGSLPKPMSPKQLTQHIKKVLQRPPLHITSEREEIYSLAWCTGAAQSYINYAIDAKVDAFLTGEVSENTVHTARENNIHFFAAGHHATERYGVKALGEHLAQEFGIKHIFVDIDNPV